MILLSDILCDIVLFLFFFFMSVVGELCRFFIFDKINSFEWIVRTIMIYSFRGQWNFIHVYKLSHLLSELRNQCKLNECKTQFVFPIIRIFIRRVEIQLFSRSKMFVTFLK